VRLVVLATCAAIAAFAAVAVNDTSRKTKVSMQRRAEVRSAQRLAEAHEAIANAELFARAEQERFGRVVGAALDAELAPGREREPCPTALPEASNLVRGSAYPILVVPRGDRDLPSPSVARVLRDVHRAENHFDAGRQMEGILYGNALADVGSRLRYDVVVATTTFKRPVRTSATSYEPGEIEGRAYLYDFAAHQVVCAGDVRTTSSPNIAYSYATGEGGWAIQDQEPSLRASLDVDLDSQLERSIARGVLFKTGGDSPR
jgi:hypothetical protein